MKPEKFSPGLLTVLNDYEKEGTQGVARYVRSLGITLDQQVYRNPMISVSLRCQRGANFEELLKAGIVVNQADGEVRTATLPLPYLDRLSEEDSIKFITPSRFLRSLLDVASAKINLPLPNCHNESHLKGENVLIGIIDTGIDVRHTAFQGRVLRIWDQTIPDTRSNPTIIEQYDYGIELRDPSTFTISQDKIGHGTHVAGIAAGSDSTFGGVAPRADLIIVNTDFQTTHIIDGIRYIFKIAEELKRPVVINLSLGGHGDPHDGSDDLSQVIDDETGPGKIVCCAAGNEGVDNIHAQTFMSPNQRKSIRFWIEGSKDSTHLVELNGWYSGEDQLEVAVQSSGGVQTPYQIIDTEQTYVISGLQVLISIKRNPDNSENNFYVRISPSQSYPLHSGTWKLLLRGVEIESRGQVDIWIMDNREGFAATFLDEVHDQMKIGSPGASARAITVASYTTAKVSWNDINGNAHNVGFTPESISDFSSPGPLRNGVQKPDVAAPGAMIVSCLSGNSSPPRELLIDQNHLVLYGTSMATPFITGLVALLLEQNPDLEPEQVKKRLWNSSLIPGQSNGIHDPKWGFGLVLQHLTGFNEQNF